MSAGRSMDYVIFIAAVRVRTKLACVETLSHRLISIIVQLVY